MSRQFPVLIVVIPLIAAFAIVAAGDRRDRLSVALATGALCLCLLMSSGIFLTVLRHGDIGYRLGGWPPPFGIECRIDRFNALMIVLISFLALSVAVYAHKCVRKELAGKTVLFRALYMLLIAGLLGIAVAGDMFNLFVLLEVASLAGYALVAAGSARAAFAGFRYLVIGTVGASFYLLGVGYLYIATGTLNMADLASILPPLYDSPTVKAAFVFIFIGFSIKIALFPLHAWQPEAYTRAPSAVTVIISSAASKTFAYALIRIVFSVFTIEFVRRIFTVFELICWMSAVAMIAGSVFAIRQNDLKRMLAYSSVANVGYIMLGVGLSPSTSLGLSPAVVHMVNHAVVKAGMFMAACGFIYRLDIRDVRDFEGLGEKMPLTCLCLILCALAMVGMPPGAGFISKWYLILAALEARKYVFVGAIFLSTLLMIVYFWRVIETMYIRPGKTGGKGPPRVPAGEMPAGMMVPCLAFAVLSFAIGIVWLSGAPAPLLTSINAGFGLGARP